MNVTTFGVATAILLSASTNLAGQTVAEHIARGDSAYALIDPAAALEHYRSAHLADPQNYEAIWKFARSQVDVANTLLDRSQRKTRDSLYGVAAAMAEGAIYLDSTDAEGHAILATAVGQLSRTKSGRERVRYGKEIYETAAKALELDPDNRNTMRMLDTLRGE